MYIEEVVTYDSHIYESIPLCTRTKLQFFSENLTFFEVEPHEQL